MKPRVYWTYYPKLRRGYWRVSPMPKGLANRGLWIKAHTAVLRANAAKDIEYAAAWERERVARTLRH